MRGEENPFEEEDGVGVELRDPDSLVVSITFPLQTLSIKWGP
jgi:hypothetical protein